MVVDPNEMLIFKLRGMQFGTAVQKKETKQPAAAARAVQAAEQAAVERQRRGRTFAAKTVSEKEELVTAESKEESTAETNLATFYAEHGRKMKGFISGQEKAAQERAKKAKAMTAKEEKEAAKGLTCVSHPWRPAYAVCEYCDRPFCYADLVSHDKNFYCLEDIDKVSRLASRGFPKTLNVFSIYAGAIFLLNAALLAYFVYPQVGFLLSYVQKTGFFSLFYNISTNYGVTFFDLVFVMLGVLSGVFLIARLRKAYIFGTGSGAVMLLIVSYEYLTTNATFLLAVSVVALLSIIVLAFSRMSAVTVEKATMEELEQGAEIAWPSVETF